MEINIKVSDDSVSKLTEKAYDLFTAELKARVLEVYPSSNLKVTHDCGPTTFTTSGFHDDKEAHIVLHELVEDVLKHGYWSKA
ncbi:MULTISPECIES: penicillin-binding protein [unclassified Providencia]|uniref:penicillin-binding protein n=1 Tax=unclassified Providencia TaxID=2633465 RepID=UPI000E87ABB4|nr:penicillin-binding protein [Providencia sp.]MBP6080565.1 DinI-like family protein [Providencia sp.]HBO22833.1 penicillin-binding protein [Providencia sp.]